MQWVCKHGTISVSRAHWTITEFSGYNCIWQLYYSKIYIWIYIKHFFKEINCKQFLISNTYVEEEIQNFSPIVLFRGTPCILGKNSFHLYFFQMSSFVKLFMGRLPRRLPTNTTDLFNLHVISANLFLKTKKADHFLEIPKRLFFRIFFLS